MLILYEKLLRNQAVCDNLSYFFKPRLRVTHELPTTSSRFWHISTSKAPLFAAEVKDFPRGRGDSRDPVSPSMKRKGSDATKRVCTIEHSSLVEAILTNHQSDIEWLQSISDQQRPCFFHKTLWATLANPPSTRSNPMEHPQWHGSKKKKHRNERTAPVQLRLSFY